jgi:hypothetical protein
LKVFLGYASEHLPAALEVHQHLIANSGLEVWFDKVSLVAGTDWDAERDAAQRQADLVLHLCSPEILNRAGVVNREIRKTLDLLRDQPFGALYAIFVRLSDFVLPHDFMHLQYVDYFESDWKERLNAAIRRRQAQLSGPRSISPPKGQIVREETSTVLELVEVEFSDVTDRYECAGSYVRYNLPGIYWTLVNSKIAALALDGYFSSRRFLRELAAEDPPEKVGNYLWACQTEEFFRRDDIVSVRAYSESFFGGPHPNHHVTTANLLGEDHGWVEIEALFSQEITHARAVLGYCEKVLAATFPDFDRDASVFELYSAKDEHVWSLISQYGVDERGITINFSPYDVLPYGFGEHEVIVPWSFCAEFLGSEYADLPLRVRKKRYN